MGGLPNIYRAYGAWAGTPQNPICHLFNTAVTRYVRQLCFSGKRPHRLLPTAASKTKNNKKNAGRNNVPGMENSQEAGPTHKEATSQTAQIKRETLILQPSTTRTPKKQEQSQNIRGDAYGLLFLCSKLPRETQLAVGAVRSPPRQSAHSP